MLNGINERRLSKRQKVKVKNFSRGTGKKIVEELDALVADKPDCLIVHAGANDITNGINERRLSKLQKVKVKNFSRGTGKKIVEELDALVADKPDCLIVHAGTNDITNGINSLNCKKKLLKKLNKYGQIQR